MSCTHICNHFRNTERRNSANLFPSASGRLIFKYIQSAYARPKKHTCSFRIKRAFFDTSLFSRLLCSSNCKVAIPFHSLALTFVHISSRIEILDLSRQLRLILGCIKMCNGSNTVLSGFQTFPKGGYIISIWAATAPIPVTTTRSIKDLSYIPIPPSVTMTCPVTYDAASDAKNATTFAISSGFPKRPTQSASLCLP